KDAAALETMEKVDTVVVDKTGTLTEGKPSLRRVIAVADIADSEVLRLAAAIESSSEHPLARAIAEGAKARQIALPAVSDFDSDPGLGAWGVVEGRKVMVGNRRMVEREGVAIAPLAADADAERAKGATAIFVVVDRRLAGLLIVADAIKATTPEALQALRSRGIRVIMLTGDDARTAQAVGDALTLDGVVADVLPQDKARIVKDLQADGR